jgi:methylase of polypeptide subunit release factors
MRDEYILTKKCGLTIKRALTMSRELSRYAINEKLDLGDSKVLKLYNQLILQDLMNLNFELPEDFLIPTICSRYEFLKYCLKSTPKSVLEIGTGASAILALMMAHLGIQVTATEVDPTAYKSALNNVKLNNLTSFITLVRSNGELIKGLSLDTSSYDLIVCNPPQYDNEYYKDHHESKRGFVGQKSELVGGRIGYEFILKLLEEVDQLSKSPPVFFQLTLPKLSYELEKKLSIGNYLYHTEQVRVGTRIRIYYKVTFSE